MKKFEHYVMQFCPEGNVADYIYKLELEGWELVAVIQTQNGWSRELYFKREAQSRG